MRSGTGIAVLVGALLAASAEPVAQQAAPARPRPGALPYTATATAILVDVVVRDRQGRPVTDLKAEDFEIYEDGTRQKLGSYSKIERGGGIGIAVRRRSTGGTTVAELGTPPESATSDDTADPPTTALVFDALAAEPLRLAQKAALAYLPMNAEVPARVGVFTTDPGLRILQRYTDEFALVRKAVRELTATSTTREELELERRNALHQRMKELDAYSSAPGGGATAAFGPGDNSTRAQAIVERDIAQIELRMLRTFETLDRDHRGYGTANALVSVIQSLASRPGRKAIVYFSEGLPASPALQARFDTLVNAANRANVSIYTVDAAGLRAESSLNETRREIDQAGDARLRQTALSQDTTDGPLMRIVERTEDLLRLDPQTGLARLADDTGGFLIRDTNDLGSAFRRIDEDNRFHYMLTYSPSNPEFDGKYRSIQVKVRRDGTQVFSRKGYLAVRASAAPILSYEAPALAVLDRGGRPPQAFPMQAVGLVFPDPGGRAVVPIVVRVLTSELRLNVDQPRQMYTGQATVLARIVGSDGETVQVLSQQYILTGTVAEMDAARKGEILFYRQPELPPGVYRLETIVFDAIAERASVRLATLTVPPRSRSSLSSLMLVRRAEQVGIQDRPADLPFYYRDLLLYPLGGEPLRHDTDKELAFYFAFHVAAGDTADATIEILSGGRTMASVPVPLAAAAAGRVQHVGRLPIDRLPPGTYELRLRTRVGQDEQVRTATFTIVGPTAVSVPPDGAGLPLP